MGRPSPQEREMLSSLEIRNHGSLCQQETVPTKPSWKKRLKKMKKEEKPANDPYYHVLKIILKKYHLIEFKSTI